MRLIGRILSVIIILGTVVALCPAADAGAFTYAGKRKRINCGVVGLFDHVDSAGRRFYRNDASIVQVLPAAAVSLFTKLDALTSMKPTGWTLENPLAATQDKFDPSYWIVSVSSARNLSRMDVLYFPGAGVISLTDEERENLRRFVDGGGVLWVDNAGGGAQPGQPLTFATNSPFFITQVGFATGGQSGADYPVSRHHPLVSSPYWLTEIDIMSIGIRGMACYYDLPTPGMSPTEPMSYDFLYQVVDAMDTNVGGPLGKPSVVANTYGSGRVVATANFVGKACLQQEPYSLPSLKLAYNIMAYPSSWTDIRKGPRHTGASIDTLGANRLVEKWSMLVGSPEDNKETAPVIYKNTVFYTHGNTLYALDAKGDDNFGLWPKGPNGEVIIWSWQSTDGGKLSAPAVATVQNPDATDPNCTPIEAVMVMSDRGTVYVLDAFPLNAIGIPISPINELYSFDTQPGSSTSNSRWPSPPIYINGWLYAVSGEGRLYANNPCLAKWKTGHPGVTLMGAEPVWQVPDLTATPPGAFKAVPRCGPAFGYMRGIYSGAIVGSVWWYNAPATVPPPASAQNDHIWAVPITVSNDRVRVTNRAANTAELVVNFPGYIHAPDPTNPASTLRILADDGSTPIPIVGDPQLNMNMGGTSTPGFITVTTASPLPTSARIYASYSLTYGPGTSLVKLDTEIDPKIPVSTTPDPAMTHAPTIIPGSPAIGPDNMSYTTGQRASQAPNDGGSVLAYLYDGSNTGGGKLKWNYFLHSGLDAASAAAYLPGPSSRVIPGVVRDQATDLMMINPQPSSSPAISGGKVFVTVSGDAAGGAPRGALLCFKANPEFVIRLTKSGGYDASGTPIKTPKSLYKEGGHGHYEVRIWQPNLINTASGAIPFQDARRVSGGANVDYDTGTITFSDFAQPKLQTMGGVETNTFSPSLPVWVFLDGVEVPIDWSTWGPGSKVGATAISTSTSDSVDLNGWNNLLWYYVVPSYNGTACTGVHSPPTVIGTTVYFVTDDGVLYALDTETGESKSQQTSQKPLWVQKIGTGTGSLRDAAVSVAGSNGVLMVPGPDGLHAFTNTSTLVADNNRLLEIDGAGDVSWSADSITWPATNPSTPGVQMAVKQGPVNKPGRARYASTGEILFANTGADQVCKIDKSGMVGYDSASGLSARWIYEKFADPRHLLSSGQPTKLRGPTDAVMWQETEPIQAGNTPPTSVVHCLIADSGNSRILDLVYRVRANRFVKWDGTNLDPAANPADDQYIDRDSGFVMPELNWMSQTDALNEKYSYNSLQLVNAVKGANFCQDVWVASSDLASTGTDTGGTSPKGGAGLGGAIMALGYRQRPNVTPPTAPGNWDYNQPTSGTVVARCDHVSIGGQSVPLSNPRYFEVAESAAGRSLLICDNYGVYQVNIGVAGIPPVVNHLWAQEYASLRRLEDPMSTVANPLPSIPLPGTPPLLATSVQRLPNGRWLIANGYAGSNLTGDQGFNGEVFEYDPNLGPGQDVTWCSPKLEWVPPIAPATLPTVWRQTNTNTYNLRQPKSAMRQ